MYTHRQGGDLYDISLVVRKQTKNNIKWVGVIKPGDVLCTHSRRLGTEGKEKLTLLNLIIRYLSLDKKKHHKSG